MSLILQSFFFDQTGCQYPDNGRMVLYQTFSKNEHLCCKFQGLAQLNRFVICFPKTLICVVRGSLEIHYTSICNKYQHMTFKLASTKIR